MTSSQVYLSGVAAVALECGLHRYHLQSILHRSGAQISSSVIAVLGIWGLVL